MSSRRRWVTFAAFMGLLVAAALYLGLSDREAPPASRPEAPEASAEVVAVEEQAASILARSRRLDTRRRARREHAASEAGPPAWAQRAYQAARREAEPSARRFFDAFARYELGDLGRRVSGTLRQTATRSFARELLAAPPRLRGGGPQARVARLGRLEFVPIEGSRAGRQLVEAELVGTVSRARGPEPIALKVMHRGGRWLVAGLGR